MRHFIVSGEGYHYIGDKAFYVSKGDTFVVPIGTEHGYRELRDLNVAHLIRTFKKLTGLTPGQYRKKLP